jgi:hypothetical protein
MNNSNKSEEQARKYVEDLADAIKEEIDNGKIIDMCSLDKALNDLRKTVEEYNDVMTKWYDSKYEQDKLKVKTIFQLFQNNVSIYENKSLIN